MRVFASVLNVKTIIHYEYINDSGPSSCYRSNSRVTYIFLITSSRTVHQKVVESARVLKKLPRHLKCTHPQSLHSQNVYKYIREKDIPNGGIYDLLFMINTLKRSNLFYSYQNKLKCTTRNL